MRFGKQAIAILAVLITVVACRGPKRPSRLPTFSRLVVPLPRMGYAIQAGAFAKVENAARFAAQLQGQGLDATYMPTSTGLYRVRFGDFRTREAAREKAESLRTSGLIDGFWIVTPEEQPAFQIDQGGVPALRRSLVETARSFLGVPYLWGGSTEQGFDCSGLAMAVYQLNGLRLPRSSQAQAEAGRSLDEAELQPGDLLFFSMNHNGQISHVGIFLGENTFIHAPSKGRKVCLETLATRDFKEHFAGGRTYF